MHSRKLSPLRPWSTKVNLLKKKYGWHIKNIHLSNFKAFKTPVTLNTTLESLKYELYFSIMYVKSIQNNFC